MSKPITIGRFPTVSPGAAPGPAPVSAGAERLLRAASVAAVAAGDVTALVVAMDLTRSLSPTSFGFSAVFLGILVFSRSYHFRLGLSALDETPWLVRWTATSLLLVSPFVATAGDPAPILWHAPVATALVIGMRGVTYFVIRRVRRLGVLVDRTVLVGEDQTTAQLVEVAEAHPEYGLHVVGVLGGDADLPTLVEALGVRRVVVAPTLGHEHAPVGPLRAVAMQGVHVDVIPRLADMVPAQAGSHWDVIGGIPLFRLPPQVARRPNWLAKRAFDLAASVVVLVVLSPVLAAAAIGVKATSRGPVLFRQTRIGRGGAPFAMLKFRTFPVDHVDDEFSLDHHECPLRWGRLLRRTSVDELPQLWNVLSGEMSLIGPRPERPHFATPLAAEHDGYADRHRVPGGITGESQVHGLWGNTSVGHRVRHDNRYIDGWSLWRDVVILLRTPWAVVRKALRSRR